MLLENAFLDDGRGQRAQETFTGYLYGHAVKNEI